jgi:malate synthase
MAADYTEATGLFLEVAVADDFADFLTLPAYERMVRRTKTGGHDR